MATTHISHILVLTGIAFSLLLVFMYCLSRIRRPPIDSKHQETLDRRLQEWRQDLLNAETSKRIANQIRLIFDRGTEPLCLPHPISCSSADGP